MNIFDRIRLRVGLWALKANDPREIPLIPKWTRSAFMSPSFSNLVTEGYHANPTVFACQLVLALTFPEPELWDWELGDNGEYEKRANSPLRALMAKPNPDMGEAELWKYAVTYCALGGNVYLWKQRARNGRVIALWPFHDGHMSPVPGQTTANGIVSHYVLDVGDGNPTAIPKGDIVHWKWMIDPQQPYRGMGALVAAAGSVDLRNELRGYVFSLLRNNATPPIVIGLAEGDDFDEDKAQRLREQWRAIYGGSNRGLPAFLEYGMRIEKLGFNLNELSFENLQNSPDADICMGYHIHPSVIGALVGLRYSTYSNFEEARRALTEQTLIPLWRSFASEMQQSFVDERDFGRHVRFAFDLGQVRALSENQDALSQRKLNEWNASLITRAEFRRALGYTTTDADNVYRESLTAMLVPASLKSARLLLNQKSISRAQRARMRDFASALRHVRSKIEPDMERELDSYFERLGDNIADRVTKLAGGAAGTDPSTERKQLTIGMENMLFTPEDEQELVELLEKYFIKIAMNSWEIINFILEVESKFDLTDPAVTSALAKAGNQVRAITQTTREELRAVLQYGNENGWSIQDLVTGDEFQPGIRDIITETYRGRAETVARTELGRAQNDVTRGRYADAGVQHVMVLDNGFENSHWFCKIVDGNVVTMDWMERNLLQHPRCVRAFAPVFDYDGDVFTDEVPWGG